VLITGESGTGKELVARALHDESIAAGQAVRRGELRRHPRDLMESELFGHEKGAFTGALARKDGPLRGPRTAGRSSSTRSASCRSALQVKLLRVLQERVIRPVGAQEVEVDVRVIAATNRDLEQEVEAGTSARTSSTG
jgi:DNA-binding NtrC family response regulator